VEVDVGDSCRGLALQPRRVVVLDVACLAVEEVEDVERDPDVRGDPVADAQVGERRRGGADRVVLGTT